MRNPAHCLPIQPLSKRFNTEPPETHVKLTQLTGPTNVEKSLKLGEYSSQQSHQDTLEIRAQGDSIAFIARPRYFIFGMLYLYDRAS